MMDKAIYITKGNCIKYSIQCTVYKNIQEYPSVLGPQFLRTGTWCVLEGGVPHSGAGQYAVCHLAVMYPVVHPHRKSPEV